MTVGEIEEMMKICVGWRIRVKVAGKLVYDNLITSIRFLDDKVEFAQLSPFGADVSTQMQAVLRLPMAQMELANDGHDLKPERLIRKPVCRLRIFRGNDTVIVLTAPPKTPVTPPAL